MFRTAALVQGSLDLLILQALTLGPYHGLGLSRRISQVTHGAFDVKPGSLFPALHRMEEHGWLASEWGESENSDGRSSTGSQPLAGGNSCGKPRTGNASRLQSAAHCRRRNGAGNASCWLSALLEICCDATGSRRTWMKRSAAMSTCSPMKKSRRDSLNRRLVAQPMSRSGTRAGKGTSPGPADRGRRSNNSSTMRATACGWRTPIQGFRPS